MTATVHRLAGDARMGARSKTPGSNLERGCLLRVVSEHKGKGSLDHRAASRARCVWRVRFVSSSRSGYLQRAQFDAQHDC